MGIHACGGGREEGGRRGYSRLGGGGGGGGIPPWPGVVVCITWQLIYREKFPPSAQESRAKSSTLIDT